MNTFRPLAVVVIVAVVSLCAFFSRSAHRQTNDVRKAATHVALAGTPIGEDSDADSPDDDSSEVDLFGNDVTDAVARYRLDATGSLYEVHSPQTEIPKLAPPKT